MTKQSIYYLFYYLGWVLSFLLVLLFLLDYSFGQRMFLGVVILLIGVFLGIRKPLLAFSLSFPVLMLGYSLPVSSNSSASLYIGDLYIFILLSILLSRIFKNHKIITFGFKSKIYILFFLLSICWIFSLDFIASLVTMISFVQLFVVYLFTINYIKDKEEIIFFLKTWIFTVSLCSITVLIAYFMGKTLIIGLTDDYQEYFKNSLESGISLVRPNFFVSGFIYAFAPVILLLFLFLLIKENNYLNYFIYLILFLINCLTLIILNNKTVFFSLLLTFLITLFINIKSRKILKRTSFGILILTLLIYTIAFYIDNIIPIEQLYLMTERLSNNSTLDARIGVWKHIMGYVFSDIKTLTLGLGPDISIRKLDLPIFNSIFINNEGNREQAADSGYIYILLNYGIFILLLIVNAIISVCRINLVEIKKIGKSYQLIPLFLFLTFTLWAIMMFSQQPGISKSLIFPVQAYAFSFLLNNTN